MKKMCKVTIILVAIICLQILCSNATYALLSNASKYEGVSDIRGVTDWKQIPESRYKQIKSTKQPEKDALQDYANNSSAKGDVSKLKDFQIEAAKQEADDNYRTAVLYEIQQFYLVLIKNVSEKSLNDMDSNDLSKYLNCLENYLNTTTSDGKNGFKVLSESKQTDGDTPTYAVEIEERIRYINKNLSDKLSDKQKEQANKVEQGAHQTAQDGVDTLSQHGTQEVGEEPEEKDYIIYKNPELADTTTTSAGTIEGVMSDADKFMDEVAEEINPIGKDTKSLQDFSKVVSGILLTIGIVLSVIMGGILGIKFMTGSVGEKADVKKLLTPYVIGCIVVFGAYAIWNLAITLFGNI